MRVMLKMLSLHACVMQGMLEDLLIVIRKWISATHQSVEGDAMILSLDHGYCNSAMVSLWHWAYKMKLKKLEDERKMKKRLRGSVCPLP